MTGVQTCALPICGTRNCDWFFTTEGILLDTAGRYSVHEEDRTEWIGFLGLLKRFRPKAPINGIIVTASIPWGYPLSRLCRRAGKAPAIGWIAGSIGVFFFGPIVCIWWLALSKWDPPEPMA